MLAGFTALLSGPLAAYFRNKNPVHKKLGSVYFYSMLFVFVTAILLSIVTKNLFLLFVGFFSFNFAWTGFRNIRIMKSGLNKIDFISGYTSISLNVLLLIFGAYLLIKSITGLAVVAIVFGAIGILTSSTWLRKLKKGIERKNWIFEHISAMGAAYIATFTAFAVTNMYFVPEIFRWLLPTLIGSIILTVYLSKARKLGRTF